MKLKVIIGGILAVAMLLTAGPALALSLGVSPSQIEIEVPGDGSVTTNVSIHYFDGDVNISLIDIPLRIEPQTIYVEAADNPVDVELTIYGDDSLGSQVYDGYIRFIAVSGGAATGGVQVIAKITNVVDGIISIEDPIVEELVTEDSSVDGWTKYLKEGTPTDVMEPVVPIPDTNQDFPWLIVIAAVASGALLTALVAALVRRLR